MIPAAGLDNVAVVLNRPRFSENIGSAARAACNMGIRRLVVVAAQNWDLERILTLATHAAAPVVHAIERHDDLGRALGPFHWVVGTTARLGGERQVVVTPTQMAEKIVSLCQTNQVALVFGPEDRGLTNEELRLCHQLVTIPTDRFSSLNLAQAVVVLCYELFKASVPASTPKQPRLATRLELDGMYEQIKELLVRINYIQPENPDYWMNKLRRFLNRLHLRAGEVSVVRGIGRQIDWYAAQCYRDGQSDAPPRYPAVTSSAPTIPPVEEDPSWP